jgi:1,4-alpha-glucan branching enzyme
MELLQLVEKFKDIINVSKIEDAVDELKTKLLNKDHYIEVKLAPFSACIFEVKPKKGTTKKTPKKTKRVIKKTK